MTYRSIINHPENGEMLNLTESTKYLGISRRKFRRIAPPPDYVQEEIYPFWSKRVLDILPTSDSFDHSETFRNGKSCGNYISDCIGAPPLQISGALLLQLPKLQGTGALQL